MTTRAISFTARDLYFSLMSWFELDILPSRRAAAVCAGAPVSSHGAHA
jgi:hypothetical protein